MTINHINPLISTKLKYQDKYLIFNNIFFKLYALRKGVGNIKEELANVKEKQSNSVIILNRQPNDNSSTWELLLGNAE